MNHERSLNQEQQAKMDRVWLIMGIIFISFNLRPAITAVGPLFGLIREDLELANWGAGLLTSLPLLAFAIMSPIAPALGKKLSMERAMILGLLILGIGMLIRSVAYLIFLLVGTVLIGLGIAICNVLLPGFIKEKYPYHIALMTGLYSTVMSIFAALASGLSVPLATGLNWGWQFALLFWMIPVILALIIWFMLDRKRQKDQQQFQMVFMSPHQKGRIWRSTLAWQVALFMGLQSTLFYVTVSWLPDILVDNAGLSLITAGWLLSFMQLIGLPASFIVPILAGKLSSQQWLVFGLGLGLVLGFAGLLVAKTYVLVLISTIVIGFTLSGNFALALTFLGLRAKTAHDAADLSGMAQSVGYLLAALGPVMMGLVFDMTKAWDVPVVLLIIISSCMLIFGLFAGRKRYVFNE